MEMAGIIISIQFLKSETFSCRMPTEPAGRGRPGGRSQFRRRWIPASHCRPLAQARASALSDDEQDCMAFSTAAGGSTVGALSGRGVHTAAGSAVKIQLMNTASKLMVFHFEALTVLTTRANVGRVPNDSLAHVVRATAAAAAAEKPLAVDHVSDQCRQRRC